MTHIYVWQQQKIIACGSSTYAPHKSMLQPILSQRFFIWTWKLSFILIIRRRLHWMQEIKSLGGLFGIIAGLRNHRNSSIPDESDVFHTNAMWSTSLPEMSFIWNRHDRKEYNDAVLTISVPEGRLQQNIQMILINRDCNAKLSINRTKFRTRAPWKIVFLSVKRDFSWI